MIDNYQSSIVIGDYQLNNWQLAKKRRPTMHPDRPPGIRHLRKASELVQN